MERRPGRALWVAWALAFAGGVSVLAAAILVARAGQTCQRAGACEHALPPIASVLAFGGTGLAVVGGLVATILAVRRLTGAPRRSPG